MYIHCMTWCIIAPRHAFVSLIKLVYNFFSKEACFSCYTLANKICLVEAVLYHPLVKQFVQKFNIYIFFLNKISWKSLYRAYNMIHLTMSISLESNRYSTLASANKSNVFAIGGCWCDVYGSIHVNYAIGYGCVGV